MECITRFIEKVRIDLTVRFTKHIELTHFQIMDNMFKGVEGFFHDSVRDSAHNEFEWKKEWRQYYENEDKMVKKAVEQAEEQAVDNELAAANDLLPLEEGQD